ncbi:MAG: M3 family metallopeptidase, partial [Bacteroidaceae bacterium]|nr:M3 family metallopeptidase [Bacteroidaceae bacterium]
ACLPTAQEQVREVEELAREMEGNDFVLQPWDFAYYSHKLKVKCFNVDEEQLRPYFPLAQVQEGIFSLAQTLYGIRFKANDQIPVFHPDVKAYEVIDRDGSFLAVLYTDFFPRASKQGGAWMTSYQEQYIENDGTDIRPHVSLTANFTPPTKDKPSLLSLDEVETFLHEFGHCLHGIFSNVRYRSLSGTNVWWDFVELPSQIMENFATEPKFLHTFARHYDTGAPIPDELVDRIVQSRKFQAAYNCIRQISFGLLDMGFYTRQQPIDEPVEQFEQKMMQRTRLLPHPQGCCMAVQFSHIMSGGYAAGYYSYKWAEVLDADAFAVFREAGIFDKETAQRFRDCILSKGDTLPPMELYRRFRGKEPQVDALLERTGIASNK